MAKKTYAQEAKGIMNKYKIRLGEKFDKGDTLSLEAMNQELGALREKQEQTRVQKRQGRGLGPRDGSGPNPGQGLGLGQGQQFANGGILPMLQNGGGVPPWTADMYRQSAMNAPQYPSGQPTYPYGQYFGDVMMDNMNQMGNIGTSQFQGFRTPSPNDLIQGRSPQFPWNQSQQNQFGSPGLNTLQGIANQGVTYNPNQVGSPQNIIAPGGGQPATAGGIGTSQGSIGTGVGQPTNVPAGTSGAGGGTPSGLPDIATVNPWQDPNIDLGQDYGFGDQGLTGAQTPDIAATQGQQGQQGNPYQFRVPWMGAAATGLGAILGNRQLDIPGLEGVEDISAQRVSPRLVDYSRGREQTMRERDLAQAMVRGAAKGRGTQQGLTQTTLAGATATQRAAGSEFNRSLQGESNENARIRNQAAQFNAQQQMQASQANLRTSLMRGQYDRENALINAQRRTNQIAGVTGAVTGYGRDLMAANQATGFMRLEEDPEYPIQQQNDAWWKRFLGVDADPYKQYTGPVRSIGQIRQR